MDTQNQAATLKKFAKWGFVIVGLAVAAPLIYLSLQGLVALVAFVVVGAVVVNLAPAFANVVGMLKIKAIEKVAAGDPIAMQQLFVQRKTEEYAAERQELEAFRVEVANFEAEVAQAQAQFGADKVADMVEMLHVNQQSLEAMENADRQTAVDLKNMQEDLAMWQAKTRIAETGQRLSARMKKTITIDPNDKLAMEASFRSMQNKINSSLVGMRGVLEAKQERQGINVPRTTISQTATAGLTTVTPTLLNLPSEGKKP
jgi:hypothetical protein